MRYTLPSGKSVNIPDKEIETSMKILELTREDAIQLWLEDNDYLENEEQNALDEKAKQIKINHGARAEDKEKKQKKPRTVIISDQKQRLFKNLKTFLEGYALSNGGNLEVAKENKLFLLQVGDKTIKIDLIEQRQPK